MIRHYLGIAKLREKLGPLTRQGRRGAAGEALPVRGKLASEREHRGGM